MFWTGLILVQALLGAATIWTDKSADIATLHVAFGALGLVTGTTLILWSYRCFQASEAHSVALAVEKGEVLA